MKRNVREVLIVELIILIFVLMLKIIVVDNYPYLVNYVNMFFWSLLAIILYLVIGFSKDNNYLKKIVTRYIIIFLLGYIILVYLLGLFTGFAYTMYSFNFLGIVRTVIPIGIFIINKEIVRYLLCKKAGKDIKLVVFLTILYVIFDIIMIINGYNFRVFEQVFIFIFLTLIPMLAKEALGSYITYKVSLVPTIVYMLAFEMVIYFLPIYPDLGNYINSVLGLLFPFVVYLKIEEFIKYNDRRKLKFGKEIFRFILIPIIVFFLVIVVLVSGIFSYKMIAIGSDSMNPVYYMGDAIIYEKKDAYEVKKGDILVFEYNKVLVTHRVKNIIKKGNKVYFQTKGDNNEMVDDILVSEDSVQGIVKYVVKYVGYPTIWFRQLF